MREISLKTDRKTQLIEITDLVRDALGGTNGTSAALVYVPHTTAGVTINEHADPAVAQDLEAALEKLVDDGWEWRHVEDPAHAAVRAYSPHFTADRYWADEISALQAAVLSGEIAAEGVALS